MSKVPGKDGRKGRPHTLSAQKLAIPTSTVYFRDISPAEIERRFAAAKAEIQQRRRRAGQVVNAEEGTAT